MSEKDLDSLFRKAAEEYDTPFDEKAWDALNDRLDGKGATGLTLNYYKMTGGILLIFILLSLFIWYSSYQKPQIITENTQKEQTEVASGTQHAGARVNGLKPEIHLDEGSHLTVSTESSTEVSQGGKDDNKAGLSSVNKERRPDSIEQETTGASTKPFGTIKNERAIAAAAEEEEEEEELLANNGFVLKNEGNRSVQQEVVSKAKDDQNESIGLSGSARNTSAITNGDERSKVIFDQTAGKDGNDLDGDMESKEEDQQMLYVIPATPSGAGVLEDRSRYPILLAGRVEGFEHLLVLPVADIKGVEVAQDSTVTEQEENDDDPAARKRVFALKFMLAPDLSSVGYFEPDRPGSNIGLMAEFYLGERWSLSGGVIRSRKIYFTDEALDIGRYASNPDVSRVDAECVVLDIPVSLSYYIQQHELHNFLATVGFSSYLMLSEDYRYFLEVQGNPTEWTQRIERKNNHIFNMLNLSITYERRINEHFYFQVEPFVKTPLSGVGEGEVDLVSSGLFLNLKYNFLRP